MRWGLGVLKAPRSGGWAGKISGSLPDRGTWVWTLLGRPERVRTPPQKKTTWDDLSWDKPWQILSWFISEGWNEHLKSLNCWQIQERLQWMFEASLWQWIFDLKNHGQWSGSARIVKKNHWVLPRGWVNSMPYTCLFWRWLIASIWVFVAFLWPYWGLSLVWPSRARSWPRWKWRRRWSISNCLRTAERIQAPGPDARSRSWVEAMAMENTASGAGFEMDRVESWDLLELKFERARKVEQMTNYGHGQQSIWMFQVVESFVWVSSWIWRQCAWCYVTRRATFLHDVRLGWGGAEVLPYQMSNCATAIWCWDSACKEPSVHNWWKDMVEIVAESWHRMRSY